MKTVQSSSPHTGFTLIEVILAAALLSIVIFGFFSAMVSAHLLEDANRERTIALQAARKKIEELHAECSDKTSFSGIFKRHVDIRFAVSESVENATLELTRKVGTQTQPAGEVIFPVIRNGTTSALKENHTYPPGVGMPRDLNGDGKIDTLDHKNDYKILPVVVRVEWTRATGNEVVELKSLLIRRQ